MKKQTIPKSLKNDVWLKYAGKKFDCKCSVSWCKTVITPFTFETGHNIPESKGGTTNVENLRPICSQCNKSMGNNYSIDEFSEKYAVVKTGMCGCFR
jgi:5-methylcytosine-specific restriction endonuclease McrA